MSASTFSALDPKRNFSFTCSDFMSISTTKTSHCLPEFEEMWGFYEWK